MDCWLCPWGSSRQGSFSADELDCRTPDTSVAIRQPPDPQHSMLCHRWRMVPTTSRWGQERHRGKLGLVNAKSDKNLIQPGWTSDTEIHSRRLVFYRTYTGSNDNACTNTVH